MAQVKSKERVKNFGEVFTSTKTVNEMLDFVTEMVAKVKKLWYNK